ncbi:MAG: S8 family serine peptidase [Bacteroidetes bacterium]|nr:S8 family serine peptidase [Bacteroidota bacterium]
MNRKISLFLLAACFVLTAQQSFSQQAYYWADGQKAVLTQNPQAIALHFFAGAMPENLEQLAQVNGVNEVEIHPAHGRAILHLNESYSGAPDAFAASLNLPAGILRSAAFGYTHASGTDMWLTHEVVLQLPEGTSLSNYSDLLQSHGARYSRTRFNTIVLDVDQPEQALALANAIQERGGVQWATPDFYAPIQRTIDPNYGEQFQMNNTGQVVDGYSSLNNIDINAPEAWAISTGSSSIVVAVIDDGTEAHEDLQTAGGASRVLSGFTPATGGNGAPISSSAHGESCSGIIAASHNEIGVRGVAPNVYLMTINIFYGGETTQDLADAFTYAKNNGADVISNSWGYYSSCGLNYSNLTSAINDASSTGRSGLGCVVVFAAGNSYGTCVDYPAKLASVMAVGAVTNLGTRSTYSNRGTDLDVVAPSNAAPGQAGAGVRTTDRMGFAGYGSGNYTPSFGGTSAACPAVAGVAALILSVDPSSTSAEVRTLITSTASDMGTAGFDNEFGHGRVNAGAALAGLSPSVCTTPPTGLNASIGATGVTISWNSLAADGAVSYVLSGRKAGVGAYQSLPAVSEPATSKFVAEAKLRAGFSYNYKVQATCTGGVVGPESAVGTFTWPGLRVDGGMATALHPNPAYDQATLVFQADGSPATVRIIDLTGRTLNTMTDQHTEGPAAFYLDVTGLQTGMYLVELTQANGRQTLPLSITH